MKKSDSSNFFSRRNERQERILRQLSEANLLKNLGMIEGDDPIFPDDTRSDYLELTLPPETPYDAESVNLDSSDATTVSEDASEESGSLVNPRSGSESSYDASVEESDDMREKENEPEPVSGKRQRNEARTFRVGEWLQAAHHCQLPSAPLIGVETRAMKRRRLGK